MTVKELIEELQKIKDKDSIAMVRGYEGGHNEIIDVSLGKAALDVNCEDWMGNHEFFGEDEIEEEKKYKEGIKIVKAVRLRG